MLCEQHYFVENSRLYTFTNHVLGDWTEVTKCLLKKGMVHLGFSKVSQRLMDALGVRHRGVPIT